MERRPGEQRLKIDERQGREAHVYGHGLGPRRRHRAPDHLNDALSRYDEGPTRGQVHTLHQHHREAREGLRQQVPRIHEGGEGVRLAANGQGDGPDAAPFIPPVDEIPDRADEQGQHTKPIDGDSQGHGPQQHPARPGAGPTQGQEQQPAPQQQRRLEQGQERTQILLSAHEQGRRQKAGDPPRQAQEPGPPAKGHQVPHRPQQGRARRPARGDRRPAQGARQLQQEPVHGEVVQQEPFEADPHATSTTITVMSSRCPFCRATSIRSSASRSRGRAGAFLSSASRSLPKRS